MKQTTMLVLTTLLSLASATARLHREKRDIVWVTQVQDVTLTQIDWTTQWVNWEPSTVTSTTQRTVTHVPVHMTSTYTHHVTLTQNPHLSSTSSAVIESSSDLPVVYSSSSVAVVEPTTTATPTTFATSTSTSPSTTSSAPTATTTTSRTTTNYTGDITYYAVGLGSCGWESTADESVIALPVGIMSSYTGSNPNNNPYCGKTVTISFNGVTETAKVVDTCEGCSGDSIDLSTSLFQEFAALTVGRVHGVTWSFD